MVVWSERMIRIPLVGLIGVVEVNGQQYSGLPTMPAMGAALSGDDLAAVLSYIAGRGIIRAVYRQSSLLTWMTRLDLGPPRKSALILSMWSF